MAPVSQQQLTRYGLLALAGLSAEAAHAGVITSTSIGFIPFTITAGQVQGADFGNGIGNAFQFFGYYNGTVGGAPTSVSFVLQTGGAGANQQLVGSDDPYRLPNNYQISAGRTFSDVSSAGPSNTGNDIAGNTGKWNGADDETVQGFLGVRFQSDALSPGFHYGFFDIAYDNALNRDNSALTIRGFAYETDSDTAITTFAISSAAAAPEPSSLLLAGLGLLSCGGAGIRSLRAQTKANAAAPTTTLDA